MGNSALVDYLAGLRPDAVAIVTALDDAIHAAAPLDSAIKWRRLTYGVDGDFHHWICAIAVTKLRVTVSFHFGALLSDPEGAFRVEESKFLRMLDYASTSDIDGELLARRVVDAVSQLDYFKANWKRIQAEG